MQSVGRGGSFIWLSLTTALLFPTVVHSDSWSNTFTMTEPENRFSLNKSTEIGQNIWNISVQTGHVIMLAFEKIAIDCYAHNEIPIDCDCTKLEVYDGLTKLYNSCASSVYPTLLTSSSNTLLVIFTGKQTKENHLYFTAIYKSVNAASVNKSCGNDVIGMEGSIVSPGFPNNYTNLLICDWTLTVSNPSLLIQLEIQSGDIEFSSECTFDSLEIYDGSTLSNTRIGRYCGALNVKLTASSRYLHMRFISNWNATGRGFQAQWTAGYNKVNLTDSEKRFNLTKSGVIGMNIWNITVESGFVVQLAFDQLNLYCYAYSYYYGCDCAGLEVFDGEQTLFSLCSSTSSLVNSLPALLTSTGNRVGIVFSGKQSLDNMLYFTAIYKSVNSTHVNRSCGKLENGTEGTIVSPGFPNNYTDVLVCEWTITSLSYVQLVIESYDLEQSPNCVFDSLQVYNGNSASNSRLGIFCGTSVDTNYIHLTASSSMFVRMVTNWNSTGRGFIAYWRTVDTYVHFTKPESRIFYPGFCFNGVCVWNITTDATKAVQLTLGSYKVECAKVYLDNPCQCSMLQAYDGSYINNGSLIMSLCYNYGYIPDVLSSSTNSLILVLRSYYQSFGMQFEASYRSINTSNACRSFSYHANETLWSPNYPLDYPNATDCIYNILLTNPGYQLVLNFTDFNVQDSQTTGYCSNDFVQINSRNYCGSDRPDTLVTNSSTSVTFHADDSIAMSGFQLTYRAQMFECGESLLTRVQGNINSPGYPLAYPNVINCTWTISASQDHVIHLLFDEMSIGDVYGFDEGDRCITYRAAYLQAFEGSASGNKTLIGTYCATEIPAPIFSLTSNLTVQFVSLYNYEMMRGFSASYITLEKSSVYRACGGLLSGSVGTFTSPHYPLAYPNNTVCEWIIIGMPDYPIRISITDLNMEASSCARDSLEFRNGPNAQSPRLKRLCGSSVPQTVTSSQNVMYVKFYGNSRSTFRGFNATWISACDQTYSESYSLHTVQFPSRQGNHSGSIRCTYIVEKYYQEGQIAVLTFSHFFLGNDSSNCQHTYIEVRDGGFETSPLVGRYCGRSNPPTVMLRQSAVWIRFIANGTEANTAFTVTVQRQSACGPQHLSGRMGNLTSPFYPNNYPLGLSCTWYITPETNYTVQLTIDDFLLEGPSGFCPYDWVKVYDGSDLIDTYCYNSYDRIITSQTPGNTVKIEFKSDSSRTFPGFSLSYVTQDPLADYSTRQYELFPFGLEHGDKQIEKIDAHAEKVYIQTGFPVASSLQYDAFVGNKGLVTFKVKDSGKDFRLKEDQMMVCPYHSDISANNGGVYYHLHTENQTVLDKASAEVLEFTNIKNYKASLVLLVTWDRVAHIRSTLPERQHATVQLALISNGRQSFALITYRHGAMNWAQLQGEPLVIGVANGNPLEVQKSIYSDTSEAFTSMGKIIGNTGRVGMWIYDLGNSYSPDQDCKDWYKSNLPHDQLRQERFQHLPQCPCSKRFLRGNMVWSQDRDDHNVECYRLNFGTSHLLEPYGMECCYMTDWSDPQTAGQFIADGIHAGSATAYNPEIQIAEYRREDRDAHNVCCYNTTSHEFCDMYYKLRPVRECTTSLPFGFSNLWGDPHIKTLDGHQYTFNGLGEYTLILLNSSSVNFTLQGRTGLAETENGTLTNATVFKAFGAEENGVRVFVELDPNTNSTLIIYADGKDYTVQFYKMVNAIVDDNKKFLLKNTNNSLLVGFMSGIEMTIKITLRSLEIAISTPIAFKNRTRGLLGNFNGVKDDDFVLPNGTTLGPNITEREIFETFGPTWSVTKTTSIMMYGQREGPDNYTHPEFKPLFLDEQPLVTRKAAEDLCGSADLACIYDYLATNSATFANASKQTAKSAEDTEKITKNTVPLIRFNSTLRLYAGNVTTFNLNGYDPDPGDILTYFMTGSMPNTVHLNSITGDVSLKADLSEVFSLSFYAIDRNDMKSPVRHISIIVCSGCSGHGDCDFNRLVSSNVSLTVQVAECVCSPAWSGPNCSEDYDACSEAPCSAHQSCTDLSPEEQGNRTKGYTCSDCSQGFKIDDSDHTRCLDVDECATELAHNCSQTCLNTPGSYVCGCKFGYRLNMDGTSCDDVNECADKANTCEHKCINNEGSFSCSCFDGYTLAQGRCQRLNNHDVCQGVQCDQGCLVQSFPNGTSVPKCFCNSGYELDPTDNKKCVDKNECTEGICSQTCRNTEGSFACGCLAGSVLSEDQRTCVPCEHLRYGPDCRLTCNCNGRGVDCDPVKGCVCQSGWTGSNCEVDVDECSGKITPCGRGQLCTNTNGSFLCTCQSGYAKAKGGNSCLDIDECVDESIQYPCSQLEVCTNAPGSYNCLCQPGYMRSNNNCSDVDECTTGQNKCQQQCENVPGSYNCHCHYGYRLNADRVTCSKVRDVCAEVESLHCDHGCTLNDQNRGICICNIGFNLAGDHQKCIDIDECATQTAGCSNNCTNIEGGFYCSCPIGMILDNDERTCKECPSGKYGINCNQICACGDGASRCDAKTGCICKSGWLGDKCDIDVNECDMEAVQAECQNKTAECFNLLGAYTCLCQEGYQENENGACQDVDECANSPCDHICENTFGSYQCLCHDGFSLNATTQRCEDINECAKSGTHNCTQQCDNIAGSYRCSCQMSGYTLDNDGITCIAKTNCSTKSCPSVNGGCSQEQCFCNSGYQLNATNNNTCDLIDTDWCASGACQQSCHETENGKSFTCGCYDGYLLNNDKRTCRGCPVGTFGPGCKSNCTCSTQNTASCNTVNGSCICKAGWSGATCSNDIDECVPPTSILCMAHAQCVNTLGSFICPCVSGFLKTQNDTCQDINECALETTNNCTQHCENTAGSYRCSCNVTGYVLDKDSATCIDVNECLGNHGCHTCNNTPGSYNCSCREGFTLNEINKTCDETTRLRFDVKIDIKEQVDLNNQTLYDMLREEARATLLIQFNKSGSGIIDIEILNISLGSLIFKTATVVWKETEQQSASIITATFVNVAGSNLTIGSYSGLTSFVVNGMQVTDNSGLCDVYNQFSICGASQECVESLGQPMCRNIQSKDNSWILIIILSTAIPLGIISLALVIFACVYCQKKKHKKTVDNSKHFYRDEASNMNIYSKTEDEKDLYSNSTMYSTLSSGRFSIDRPKIDL